jgi:anion-transporting  ArsA/GET3 family ATPase
MPIILLINLKGGVAKTTNAVAIAECFASEGFRTLLMEANAATSRHAFLASVQASRLTVKQCHAEQSSKTLLLRKEV